MGDSPPSSKQAARDALRYLAQYAPEAISAITKTTPEIAKTQADIDTSLRDQANELFRSGELAAAGTEADVVRGPGAELVSAADKYQRQLDPEFYANRAVVGDAVNKYLTSYDPNRLSDTDVAEISRGINATTGPIAPSAMNAIKNAQVFGNERTKRWQNFGEAVTRASSALGGLKSGLTGFDIARTRKDNPMPNYSGNALNAGFGFASSALGDITGAQTAAMNKRKDTLDMVIGGTQAFSNILNGVGSVIGGPRSR